MPIALDVFLLETSKVGCNGTRGDCIVLYCKEDSELQLSSMTERYEKASANTNTEAKTQLLIDLKIRRRELFEMILFAENLPLCRQIMMLTYLNEENVVEPCGRCDICEIMKKSFVVNFSFSLKKILMAIWSLNDYQVKGVKSDDFFFASIEFLIDLLMGTPSDHTLKLRHKWYFGSFGSWDKNILHTLIIVLLIKKFATVNIVTNNEFGVYQNLVLTFKGQQFIKSTCEVTRFLVHNTYLKIYFLFTD